jgi:hypothetical protein
VSPVLSTIVSVAPYPHHTLTAACGRSCNYCECFDAVEVTSLMRFSKAYVGGFKVGVKTGLMKSSPEATAELQTASKLDLKISRFSNRPSHPATALSLQRSSPFCHPEARDLRCAIRVPRPYRAHNLHQSSRESSRKHQTSPLLFRVFQEWPAKTAECCGRTSGARPATYGPSPSGLG